MRREEQPAEGFRVTSVRLYEFEPRVQAYRVTGFKEGLGLRGFGSLGYRVQGFKRGWQARSQGLGYRGFGC